MHSSLQYPPFTQLLCIISVAAGKWEYLIMVLVYYCNKKWIHWESLKPTANASFLAAKLCTPMHSATESSKIFVLQKCKIKVEKFCTNGLLLYHSICSAC